MNKVILIGNVAREPEQHTTQGGTKKATFSLAVNRDYRGANGERIADFFNCVAWREKADLMEKYAKKGKMMAVWGCLQTRKYDAQDGSKRTVTEIIIDHVEFIGRREDSDSKDFPEEQHAEMTSADDPDLPF